MLEKSGKRKRKVIIVSTCDATRKNSSVALEELKIVALQKEVLMKNKLKFKGTVVKLKKSQIIAPDEQLAEKIKNNKNVELQKEPDRTSDPVTLPLSLNYRTETDCMETRTAADVACTFHSRKIYVCMFCHSETIDMKSLTLHQITAHPNKVFSCSECGVLCYSEDNFNAHLSTVHNKITTGSSQQLVLTPNNKKPSIHVKLSKEYNNKNNNHNNDINELQISQIVAKKQIVVIDNELTVKKGVKVRTKKRRGWRCKLCQNISPTKEEHMIHKQTHGPPTCRICNKLFLSYYKLRIHERMHTNEKPFVCEYCGKCFSLHSNLKLHLHTHGVSIYKKPYKCTNCRKAYASKNNLSIHMKSHCNNFPYLCDICGKVIKRLGQFQVHRKLHLDPEFRKRYTCDICGKQCCARNRLVEHKRLHTNELPLQCSVCGKRFRTQHHLAQHVHIHINARRYSCSICGKRFNRRGNMNTHMKRHDKSNNLSSYHLLPPNDNKTFECQFCQEGFFSKWSLMDHERLHKGVKPFTCEECGKSFRLKITLIQHLIVHSDERPFPCPHCKRCFRRRDYLDVHLRIHTGERPYACNVCGREFRQKGDCMKHQRAHDKINQTVKNASTHTSDIEET